MEPPGFKCVRPTWEKITNFISYALLTGGISGLLTKVHILDGSSRDDTPLFPKTALLRSMFCEVKGRGHFQVYKKFIGIIIHWRGRKSIAKPFSAPTLSSEASCMTGRDLDDYKWGEGARDGFFFFFSFRGTAKKIRCLRFIFGFSFSLVSYVEAERHQAKYSSVYRRCVVGIAKRRCTDGGMGMAESVNDS